MEFALQLQLLLLEFVFKELGAGSVSLMDGFKLALSFKISLVLLLLMLYLLLHHFGLTKEVISLSLKHLALSLKFCHFLLVFSLNLLFGLVHFFSLSGQFLFHILFFLLELHLHFFKLLGLLRLEDLVHHLYVIFIEILHVGLRNVQHLLHV